MTEPIRPLTPREYCRLAPFQCAAASDRRRWAGLEALLYNDMSDAEFERQFTRHTKRLVAVTPG